MVIPIADLLQETLRDGSCLLTGGSPTALTGGPTTTVLTGGSPTSLTGGSTTAAALTAGTTTLKSGTAAGAASALSAGAITMTILSFLAVGVLAYGVNVSVRAYID